MKAVILSQIFTRFNYPGVGARSQW